VGDRIDGKREHCFEVLIYIDDRYSD